MEILLVLTIYSLITGSFLAYQNHLKEQLKETTEKTNNYRNISKTAEKCSYIYFHGPSTKINQNYTNPTWTDGRELTLTQEDINTKSKTFSTSITSTEKGIICASTKPWYLKTGK